MSHISTFGTSTDVSVFTNSVVNSTTFRWGVWSGKHSLKSYLFVSQGNLTATRYISHILRALIVTLFRQNHGFLFQQDNARPYFIRGIILQTRSISVSSEPACSLAVIWLNTPGFTLKGGSFKVNSGLTTLRNSWQHFAWRGQECHDFCFVTVGVA